MSLPAHRVVEVVDHKQEAPIFLGRRMNKSSFGQGFEVSSHGVVAEVWPLPDHKTWKGTLSHEDTEEDVRDLVAVQGSCARDTACKLEMASRALQYNLKQFLGPVI